MASALSTWQHGTAHGPVRALRLGGFDGRLGPRLAPSQHRFKMLGARSQAFAPATARASGRVRLSILCKESRIGRVPITVPKGVTVTIDNNKLKAKGPIGTLEWSFPTVVKLEQANGKVSVSRTEESKLASSQHGLSRTLASNMILGVGEGFTKRMDLFGTGYRASVTGKDLTLNVGYNKPRILPIPAGLKVTVEKNTAVSVFGADKVVIGDFCASVRRQRPPEPYKGKGVRYAGEVIKLKEGKSATKKK